MSCSEKIIYNITKYSEIYNFLNLLIEIGSG